MFVNRDFIENCARLGYCAASSGNYPEARSSRLLRGGTPKSFDVPFPSELFLSSVRSFPTKSIRSANFFRNVSHLMRITLRFLESLILLPSSQPALSVYRVILQGLGLRSVEEGLLTWDGCDVKRQTCQ